MSYPLHLRTRFQTSSLHVSAPANPALFDLLFSHATPPRGSWALLRCHLAAAHAPSCLRPLLYLFPLHRMCFSQTLARLAHFPTISTSSRDYHLAREAFCDLPPTLPHGTEAGTPQGFLPPWKSGLPGFPATSLSPHCTSPGGHRLVSISLPAVSPAHGTMPRVEKVLNTSNI